MASGFQGRIGIAKETTFGTRVAPTRFPPFTAEDLGFTVNRATHSPLGQGMWGRVSVVTTKVGGGALSGDVMTTGMGYLLDGLHGETVTPVQEAATTAYLQTHTLTSPPDKTYSVQVQVPPPTSATLVPHDMLGVMMSGATFSWSQQGLLSFEIPTVYRDLDTSQSSAAYVPPNAYTVFSFKDGTVLVGGVAEANVLGDGSFSLGYSLRDDGFALGTGGLIAKPTLTAKPTATGTFTADFDGNTNLNRTLNNTIADVTLRFEGATIATTYKYMFEITIPDCVFTTGRPTVNTEGPIQQTVTFENSSSAGDPVVIKYRSTDVAL